MAEKNQYSPENDWELSDDFYNEGSKETMSLDDFIEEGGLDLEDIQISDSLLQKTVEDVRKVMALAADGKIIADMAKELGMEEQYVYNIMVCAEAFHEDDEVAVAHLVMMG